MEFPLPNQLIPVEKMDITSRDEVPAAWFYVEQAIRNAKALKEKLEKCLVAIRDAEQAETLFIDLPDGCKLIVGKERKDKFETEFIYKALEFTDEQKAVLPKNPSWRKTAILANAKTGAAWSEDTVDSVKVKEFNPKFVKK